MQTILEMVEIIRSNKLGVMDIVGHPDSTGKLTDFYEGIKAGAIQSDADAAAELGFESASAPGYYKLKQRFRDRLVNSLLLLDTRDASYTDYQKAYYNCHRMWAAAMIAQGKGARNVSRLLFKRILKLSQIYEFTELSLMSAKALAIDSSDSGKNAKELKNYSNLTTSQLEVYEMEIKSMLLFNKIYQKAHLNSSVNNLHLEEISRAIHEIKAYLSFLKTGYLYFLFYLLNSLKNELENDIKSLISTCNTAVEFFQENYPNRPTYIIAFLMKLIHTHKFNGDIRSVNITSDVLKNLSKPGELNWFFACREIIVSYLYNEQYSLAFNTYAQVIKNRRYKLLPAVKKEPFVVISAIFHFLQLVEVYAPELKNKFNVGFFLNSVPEYTKDKKGMNITITIFQTLIYLCRGDYLKAHNMVNMLCNYKNKHLKESHFEKTRQFIDLLKELDKYGFNKALINSNSLSRKYLILKEQQEASRCINEFEIIPYTAIWNYLVVHLDIK